MEVRRVIQSKFEKGKQGKKILVSFTEGSDLENKNKKLQYKKNDIVFVEADIKGIIKIKEYHAYSNLMKYLEELNDKDKNNKSLLINKFTNVFNLDKSYLISEEEKKLLEQIESNNEVIKKSLKEAYDWTISFSGELNDKLIMGLGNQSVFETDITLHHTYGIPYIPGSAIKGVLRNFVIQEYFKECTDKCDEKCERKCEELANSNEIFCEIFGGKNKETKSIQGEVIFMDSFPIEHYKIERDVMTPHHSEYHMDDEGKKLPLDLDTPNPIYFLVLKNSKFQFNIAVDKMISNKKLNEYNNTDFSIFDKYKDKSIKEFILENLIDALNYHGIGAKTSVGYGYFDIDKKQVMQEFQKRLKEEKELKRRIQEEKKFEEATKGKSELQIRFYEIDKIGDKNRKNEEIMDLFNNNIDLLEEKEQKQLAEYVKGYLERIGKWKYKSSKKGKVDKKSKRIEKICDILNIEIPYK